jgi:HAE1 family hydrophobic/amphiphilic exporter-1
MAAREGAVSRLRPILMTSFAFVAGLIPLCISNGAGALGNRSIGTSAAGGMLIGTVFGLFLIPGLYAIFASLGRKNRNKQTVDDRRGSITVIQEINTTEVIIREPRDR